MIRTRDVFLFVTVLVFLLVAIGNVLLFSNSDKKVEEETFVAFISGNNDGTAITTIRTLDREKNIQRLKEKIANSSELVTPSPSVESAINSSSDTVSSQLDSSSGVQRCLYPDDALALVPRWPLKDVEVGVAEGARVVTQLVTLEAPNILGQQGTSSTSTPKVVPSVQNTTRTLLQMPIIPIKNTEVSCVPSEVVGVTLRGLLIFNGDVNAYRGASSETLIGYARDGFPIYGMYDGEVDACGGYDSSTGYRYTLSPDRDYVVGCYVGTPQKLSL